MSSHKNQIQSVPLPFKPVNQPLTFIKVGKGFYFEHLSTKIYLTLHEVDHLNLENKNEFYYGIFKGKIDYEFSQVYGGVTIYIIESTTEEEALSCAINCTSLALGRKISAMPGITIEEKNIKQLVGDHNISRSYEFQNTLFTS